MALVSPSRRRSSPPQGNHSQKRCAGRRSSQWTSRTRPLPRCPTPPTLPCTRSMCHTRGCAAQIVAHPREPPLQSRRLAAWKSPLGSPFTVPWRTFACQVRRVVGLRHTWLPRRALLLRVVHHLLERSEPAVMADAVAAFVERVECMGNAASRGAAAASVASVGGEADSTEVPEDWTPLVQIARVSAMLAAPPPAATPAAPPPAEAVAPAASAAAAADMEGRVAGGTPLVSAIEAVGTSLEKVLSAARTSVAVGCLDSNITHLVPFGLPASLQARRGRDHDDVAAVGWQPASTTQWALCVAGGGWLPSEHACFGRTCAEFAAAAPLCGRPRVGGPSHGEPSPNEQRHLCH